MSETEKDHGIMLFGRKIPWSGCQILANSGAMDACNSFKKTESETPRAKNSLKQENSSELRDCKQNSNHNLQENEATTLNHPRPVEADNVEETNSAADQDKIMKKPDKILRCPRCKSMETKFCYFNNYNVSQPRHFCKSCQRYWTAGGAMRNVPVGAGRRKHKHLASQFRHIIVTSSDGVPATTRLESADSSVFSSLADNASVSVLKFGLDTDNPLREPTESTVNLRDHKRRVDSNSTNNLEYGEDSSLCGSSVTNVSTQEHNNNIPNWLQCYPYPPWVLPWSPSNWNNVVAIGTPSTIPIQLVPPPYWNGTPMMLGSGNGTVSIGSCISPSSSTSNSFCSGNGSQTLGKHTRDLLSTDDCVLVPKAARNDGPTCLVFRRNVHN